MSKHRVLSLKPQLRLAWRGQDGQNETEQTDHSASLGDSIASSTRIRFSVHTGLAIASLCEIAAIVTLVIIVTNNHSASEAWLAAVFFAVVGGVSWLAGRTAKYILAGI
jgi:hypothetical protein